MGRETVSLKTTRAAVLIGLATFTLTTLALHVLQPALVMRP